MNILTLFKGKNILHFVRYLIVQVKPSSGVRQSQSFLAKEVGSGIMCNWQSLACTIIVCLHQVLRGNNRPLELSVRNCYNLKEISWCRTSVAQDPVLYSMWVRGRGPMILTVILAHSETPVHSWLWQFDAWGKPDIDFKLLWSKSDYLYK